MHAYVAHLLNQVADVADHNANVYQHLGRDMDAFLQIPEEAIDCPPHEIISHNRAQTLQTANLFAGMATTIREIITYAETLPPPPKTLPTQTPHANPQPGTN